MVEAYGVHAAYTVHLCSLRVIINYYWCEGTANGFCARVHFEYSIKHTNASYSHADESIVSAKAYIRRSISYGFCAFSKCHQKHTPNANVYLRICVCASFCSIPMAWAASNTFFSMGIACVCVCVCVFEFAKLPKIDSTRNHLSHAHTLQCAL